MIRMKEAIRTSFGIRFCEAVGHRVGDGERRAEAQHLHEHRVFLPDPAQEVVGGRGRLAR
jgi:hypothetical protein